jgi:glutathione synthase/RimK-type ligase-like ATP-grasp enzyme
MVTIIARSNSMKCESGKIAQMMGCKKNDPTANIWIRWGCTTKISGEHDVINSRYAIMAASNKLQSLKIMTEAGVPTVRWDDCMLGSYDEFAYAYEGSQTLYGRKFYHTKGKDIVTFKNHDSLDQFEKFLQSDFYTVKEEIQREYRVHAIRGETMCTLKYKVKGNGGLDPNPDNPDQCRNWDAGWWFTTVEGTAALKEIGRMAVKCLGLDFGAVDIIQNTKGEYHVLEVNTAPGLDNRRRTWYCEQFNKIIQGMS